MKVKVYKAYSARKANELNLAVNDIIEVEEKTSIDLWKGRLDNGNSGFFPTTCVVPLDGDTTPTLNANKRNNTSSSAEAQQSSEGLAEQQPNSSSSVNSRRMPFKPLKQIGAKKDAAPVTRQTTPIDSSATTAVASGAISGGGGTVEAAPKLPPKPVREQVRVIYAYKAQNEDELTIKEGDIITVISKDNEDAGWWKGELNGRIALFPDNFVEMIQPSPPPPLPRPADSEKLRVKKPDRGTAPPAGAVSPATTVAASTADAASAAAATTTAATSNAFSSVPIIGKMLKFTHNNNNSASGASTASPQKSAIATANSDTLSSQSSASANGPSKVAPDASDNSAADEDKSNSKEDPFNDSEPISPTKLVHLTAQRPKIPSSSRRPPSMHLGKNTESIDFMDSMEESTEPPQLKTKTTENSKVAPSNMPSLKPVLRPEQEASGSSPEKKAPWLSDLKKAQERRRTNELLNNEQNRKSINGPPAPTTKPHAPTPPGVKPFVSSSSKPTLLSTQISSPSSSAEASPNHSNHSATTTTEATSPLAKPSSGTSPGYSATNSETSYSHTPTPRSPGTTAVNTGATVNGEATTTSPGLVDAKLLAARDEELAKMRTEMADLRTTVNDLRASVAELRKELAANITNTKSASEWREQKVELEKQLQEQHNFFEAHKKNLTDMVKELINELAEEKKKIAGVQIELDRMRKLTTTV